MPYPTLQPGDTVGVIAPAGPAPAERVAAIPALLARHGLRARLYPSCHARHPRHDFLAGDDALRAADVHAAFEDPDVAAIVCLRGGYGSGRLLDRLEVDHVRRHPKLLVGYSDITALHAWLHRAGLPSLHAPMLASDLVLPGREDDEAALMRLLMWGLAAGVRLGSPAIGAQPHTPGVAEGRLIGGNLSLVASLLGTRWHWNAEGAILFLEDINEEPYRVDRLLNQLQQAAVLEAVNGIVLGSFSDRCHPGAVLEERLLPLGKPLLAGWPSGHGTPNRPLPLGLRVRLDATAGELTLLEDLLVAPAGGSGWRRQPVVDEGQQP